MSTGVNSYLSTMLSREAAHTHHSELQAAEALGGRARALDQELKVHGAKLQPWLDHGVACLRGKCCTAVRNFPGHLQATLCLRSRCAPPALEEEAQLVALWVGAGEAWQQPARAVLRGQGRGSQQGGPASLVCSGVQNVAWEKWQLGKGVRSPNHWGWSRHLSWPHDFPAGSRAGQGSLIERLGSAGMHWCTEACWQQGLTSSLQLLSELCRICWCAQQLHAAWLCSTPHMQLQEAHDCQPEVSQKFPSTGIPQSSELLDRLACSRIVTSRMRAL